MPLNGFDIYSGTPEADVVTALASDFVIVKATEGLTYTNPKHDEHVQRARDAGRLVGHYHYAHVTNDPTAEAFFFVTTAKAQPGDVLDLDFEPYGQQAPDSVFPAWVVAFADEVLRLTGIRGWIYLNEDMARRLAATAAPVALSARIIRVPAAQLPPSTRQQATQPTLTYRARDVAPSTPASMATIQAMPLWKARYASTPGDPMGWPEITCWQRTGSPMDVDVFYGDAARWRALGVPEEDGMALSPDEIRAVAEAAGAAAARAVWDTRIKEAGNETVWALLVKAAGNNTDPVAVVDELAKRVAPKVP